MAETTKAQTKKSAAAAPAVPLTDILYRTLHYWPWVLLSLVVCVGAGVIYLLRTPNVYTTTASIMIKDESAGKSAGAEDFGDFGWLPGCGDEFQCAVVKEFDRRNRGGCGDADGF